MRLEGEVRNMLDILVRHNADLAIQISREPDRFAELAAVLNSNATIICALKWVMGEETLAIVQACGERPDNAPLPHDHGSPKEKA